MGMSENDKKKEYLRGYRDSVYQISRIQAEIDEVRELKASVPSCGTGKNRKSWKEDLSKRISQLSTMEDKLKAEKEKAIAAGNYDDCREDIARRYGKLLSYTDEGIKRLLDANSETEE